MPIERTPGGGGGGGTGITVLDEVQQSTALHVTATTAATAQVFVTGNAVTYDGATQVMYELHAPGISVVSGQTIICELYEDGADTGLRMGQAATGGLQWAMRFAGYRTPTAGSHTASMRFWVTASTGDVTGNGGGIFLPAWYRITKNA